MSYRLGNGEKIMFQTAKFREVIDQIDLRNPNLEQNVFVITKPNSETKHLKA